MRRIDNIEEIKELELGVLREVHKFCVDNNLKYFLDSGTLIGAIRHNGFIPWDDDIDISMPRKDFEYFIKHFDSENFGVNHCTTNKEYIWSFGKAYDKRTLKIEPLNHSKELGQGIDVDIFILNDCHDIEFANSKLKKYRRIRKLWSYSTRKSQKVDSLYTLLANIICTPLSIFTNKFANKMNELSMLDNTNGKDDCYQSMSVVGNRINILKKDWFKEGILHKFEDDSFYVPIGYDELLTYQFGDYMTPPSIKDRESTHLNEIYIK